VSVPCKTKINPRLHLIWAPVFMDWTAEASLVCKTCDTEMFGRTRKCWPSRWITDSSPSPKVIGWALSRSLRFSKSCQNSFKLYTKYVYTYINRVRWRRICWNDGQRNANVKSQSHRNESETSTTNLLSPSKLVAISVDLVRRSIKQH